MLNQRIRSKKIIRNAKDAVPFLSSRILDKNREHFVVLNLNARHHPISSHTISIGTLNSNLVHPREVFLEAIKRRAACMIIAHNHPSGGLEPSNADIELTKRLRDAGQLLGIHVIDHIILDERGNHLVI